MYSFLSRPQFLTTAAALGTIGSPLPILQGRSLAANNTAPTRLIAARRTINVNGKPASVFGIHHPDGTPGLVLDPGKRFDLILENQTSEPTIVHWHGQTPPVRQDGVVDTGLETPIESHGSQRYDFVPRAGTYWMHSHHGLQEQLLLAAPLIVRTEDDLHSDAQDVTVLLHDFTFRDPAEILAQLTGRVATAQDSMAMPSSHADMKGMHGMDMQGMTMNRRAPTPTVATPAGPGTSKTGMVIDLNDIAFDAYLTNDRTLADPLVVRAERNGRVRLRLINGATSTAFWIELGQLTGTVVAVDGDPVKPVLVRRIPLAEAQRVDITVQLPPAGGAFAVLAQREGDRQRTGFVLATPNAPVRRIGDLAKEMIGPVDLSLERRLEATHPLPARPPDIVHEIALTGTMMSYRWSINDRIWAEHEPLMVRQGQRVELEIINRTQMAHPMHLHGHHFQVVALDGQPVRGPMRDTVFVPVNGSVRIAFDADNPGRWLFHCHNLYHMATGMMTEVAYDHFT